MNLFKVNYPSGLQEYIHDEAHNVEAFVMKIAGKTLEEAKAVGLKVEHMLGMHGGVAPVPESELQPIAPPPADTPPPVLTPIAPVDVPAAEVPASPAIPEAVPAVPPAALAVEQPVEQKPHEEFERDQIMAAAEARAKAMRDAAAAQAVSQQQQT